MASRMDRYAKKSSNNEANLRSSRNKNLYSDIYAYGKYSNIEGIADIEKTNQVDIAKVKELIESRENYQTRRKYRVSSGDDLLEQREKHIRRFPELEEKNYDIRDILKEAKENSEPDNRERALKNTQYNILKNIDLKKEIKKEDYYDEDDADDLKEMIKTITNTSMLNKMGDAELASDMLSDLKDDDTKVGELNNVKDLIEENKVKTRMVNKSNDDTNYDRSFFTSSLKLSKSDFVGGGSKSKLGVIIITLLIVIMIASAAILVMKMFF
ncbi:MAG: hypothetical protein Q4E61_02345 [Alphaproteobacteria bacterium]|nr:hypothetical protein [Alphaproteobacteria bacterium]